MMKLALLNKDNKVFLSLDEVKSWCRIIGNDDDAQLNSLINASMQYFETYTSRVLIPSVYECEFVDEKIILPRSPVIEILTPLPSGVSVVYDYAVAHVKGARNLKVQFKAGYQVVPELIKTWALNKISNWYEHRETFIVGASVAEIPKSHIDCVLNAYKVRYE